MKLSSISLIASALAATAGNTIAAPGPLHARYLQQVNLFERDIDSVDLFTRNPPDPEHPRQSHLHPGWYCPTGSSPQLPPGPLVDMTKDHLPRPPLADPGHHQLYPHPQDHVPPGPQPPVEHTRHRQNVHGAPPNHRHTEAVQQSPSRSAPPLQLSLVPLPQHPHDAPSQQPALYHHYAPSQQPAHPLQHWQHPTDPAQHQALWQPPHSKNLSQKHKDHAHQHRLAGRSLFISHAVAQYAATVLPPRAPHYTKVADNLKPVRDKHFEKQRSLLAGEKVAEWRAVMASAKGAKARGDTQTKVLWDAIENEHHETKEARDAKKKEIEQKVDEHDWNLCYPGQPYRGHPGQHQ